MTNHLAVLLAALGIASVAGIYGLTRSPGADSKVAAPVAQIAPPRATPTPTPPRRPRWGHLLLQIEGDVQKLRVTWITPKASGFNPTRISSEFAVDLHDATGRVLGTYPLDLSRFDTDPARVGGPLQVRGCEVRYTRIAMLTAVPFLPAAKSLTLRRGKQVLGRLGSDAFANRLRQGETR